MERHRALIGPTAQRHRRWQACPNDWNAVVVSQESPGREAPHRLIDHGPTGTLGQACLDCGRSWIQGSGPSQTDSYRYLYI
jgi:hypothetical protein